MLNLDAEEWHYFIVRQSLFLGILALGVAGGAHLGVTELQSACIADGVLPQPGTEVTAKAVYTETACWQSALTLQQIANYGGMLGAVLLLAGGALDRYPERTKEVLFG